MSVGIASRFYEKTINFVKKYISPEKIDFIENKVFICVIPMTLFGFALYSLYCSTKNENESEYTLTSKVKKHLGPTLLLSIIGLIFLKIFVWHNENTKNPFIENELKKIAEASRNKSDPSILVFISSADFQGSLHKHKVVERYKNLATDHRIELVPIDPATQLPDLESALRNKYDRIEFNAHGNQNGMLLAPKLYITKDLGREGLKFFDHFSKDDSKIILNSCSTGRGNENIAKELSKACPTSTVYAPKTDINENMTDYASDGTPTFHEGVLWKGKDVTRVYRNGVEVSK